MHSLDYYSGTVFPSEDSMPHRCGLFTIRTPPPTTLDHQEGGCSQYICVCITMCIDSVSDYVEGMKGKVQPLLVKKEILSETEIKKMGKKDPESYP